MVIFDFLSPALHFCPRLPVQGMAIRVGSEINFAWVGVFKIGFYHRYLIEVDCSSGQFKSAKLKDRKYTTNAPNFFHIIAKKKKNGWTKFLTFVGGRWSAVDFLLMMYLPLLDVCGSYLKMQSLTFWPFWTTLLEQLGPQRHLLLHS